MEEERTITLDLGSSPDPLIDPVLSPPMLPPSHIKKKSQAAERLYTVLAPSPRKQTFELDVGNRGSPQRLLVTVEADDDGARNNTSRRLFQSPTPRRRATPKRETTITTTVPLRGLSDDEGAATSNATPRRRGRPRKSGTPIATRKRPGTPAKGRARTGRASISPQKDILTSDIALDTTPRPASQPRRAAKRKATSPAKEDGAPDTQPRKRGRPRKQTPVPEDVDTRLHQGNMEAPRATNYGVTAPAVNDASFAGNHLGDGMEDDIWLATMSDQPSPAARRQQHLHDSERRPRDQATLDSEQELQLPRAEAAYQHEYDWPDMGGGGGDSFSEAGSQASENRGDGDQEDTIMAGEEFTMISIGSLPSMQPNSSVMAPQHEDLGEATSLIINGALESLRQSQSRLVEEAASTSTGPTSVAIEEQLSATTATEESFQQYEEPQLPALPAPRSPQTWSRSPRRTRAQPFAKQLAQKALEQGTRQSPLHDPPVSEDHDAVQDSGAYEDSFSEIPEAILTAATPRRYRKQQQSAEEAAVEDIQPSIERPSRVNHSNPQSETNRLLTPDETPSPIPSDAEDHEPSPHPQPPAASVPTVEMPSSPPIESPLPPQQQPSHTSILHHIRRNSTETPADQLSSFTSSNTAALRDPQQAAVHLPIPDSQPRPSLSPIVRAGRALQLITSDPPSPPGRDSVLGSPFRGSVPRSTQSPAPGPGSAQHTAPAGAAVAPAARSPSLPRADDDGYDDDAAAAQSPQQQQQQQQRSWLAPLSHVKDFIVRSAQSLSPARAPSAASVSRPAPVSVPAAGGGMDDDPFGPDPGELTGTGSVRSTLFSGPGRRSHGLGQAQRHDRGFAASAEVGAGVVDATEVADTGVGVVGSALDGVEDNHDDDEDAMSWQEEGSHAGASQQRLVSRRGDDFDAHDTADAGLDWMDRRDELVQDPGLAGGFEDHELEVGLDQQAEVPMVEQEEEEQQHNEEQQPQQQEEQAQDEEEEDIWAIEAQRPTPYAPRNAPREPVLEPPRRGKIPSPWRRNSRRLIYSDEVEQEAEQEPIMAAQNRATQAPGRSGRDAPTNEEEEFSLLAQSRKETVPVISKAPATKKPDLAAFFSSPATVPDLQEAPDRGVPQTLGSQRSEMANAAESRARRAPARRPPRSGDGLFSQYLQPEPEEPLPSIPQKRLEIGTRERSVDLFSPVRRSTEQSNSREKMEPARRSVSPADTEEARLRGMLRDLGSTPRQRRSRTGASLAVGGPRLASPETPEGDRTPAHIPQKLNFTPRQRQSGTTLFEPKPTASANTLFGNSQVSAFFSQSRPQTQRPPGRREQEVEEDDESSFASPTLNPLPPRAVSPGKSSFRSPLKPKTPGRVVEFTSSTLSPLEQAQARAERRASMSPEKEADDHPSRSGRAPMQEEEENEASGEEQDEELPEPSPEPEPEPESEPELEPERSRPQQPPPRRLPITTTTTNRTQPATKPTGPPPALSPTRWTRAHWDRLDELLQARRRGTLAFQLEVARRSTSTPAAVRTPGHNSHDDDDDDDISTSGSSRSRHLLGKVVSAQGESLALEGWHLDVVDAFRGEVLGGSGSGPGGKEVSSSWDETAIAKRVFALLVGEERRRLGLVPSRGRREAVV